MTLSESSAKYDWVYMTVDELVARLDAYFRVADVRGDEWSAGFEACYPVPYWRDYAEAAYENRWNGLMVRGAEQVQAVVTCVFPSDAIIRTLEPNTFLFSEHPLDFDEVSLFKPLSRATFERMRATGISFYHVHAPLDMHPEVSPSRLIAIGLRLEELEEYGPIAEGIPGGACIIGTTDASLDELAERLQSVVGSQVPVEIVTRPRERGGRVAVVGGGGASVDLLQQSLDRGCSTYVTGGAARRPKHSFFGPKFDSFRGLATQHDVALIDGTHYGTEKPPQLAMVNWFRGLGLDARFEADGPKLRD